MKNNKKASPAANLLLLPGLMCGDAFWQALVTNLPQVVQTVDYGDADSLTAMAEVVLAVAPPTFALAGHSMGGRVALEVVRLAPARVEKLILMDTGYLPRAPGEKGEVEKASRMALVTIAQTQGVRAMCAEWVKGMVHPARLADAVLLEAITVMFEQKSAGIFARQQHALLNRPDASDVLASLNLPCLILCGRQDGWANVAQHDAMHALAPQSQMCVIEDAGHMVLMERPDQTCAAIREFLQSVAL